MESIFIAYIDAYFVLFQNIRIDLWPEVLFFHCLPFVVQLKWCNHKPFHHVSACVISRMAVTSWQHVLSCFISYCCFEHKEFAESVTTFLLASTLVSELSM